MIFLSSFKKKHVLEIGMFLWLFLFFHIMDVMKDSKTKKKKDFYYSWLFNFEVGMEEEDLLSLS